MKNIIILTLTIVGTLANADVQVIKSNLNGYAIELPEGKITVIAPSVTIQDKNFRIYSDRNSKKAACLMLGKREVVSNTDELLGNSDWISFDINGGLEINSEIKNLSVWVIKTLTCI